jgi:hypothetical protein
MGMDERLKEAIATVRAGDKREAQRQLTELLHDNPQQVQGWYLLSLLVDSPQKQAAYLSKTLALDPQHEKAKAQLAALQTEGSLAATATIEIEAKMPLDVVAQAESDELPDWLTEGADLPAAAHPEPVKETAVTNETLPDWLQEAAVLDTESSNIVAEEPTVAGQTTQAITEPDKAVATRKQPTAKAARSAPQNSRSLNIILGLLVIVALVVMVLLVYLLLG